MAFHTFGPGLALDKITMKGLSTVTAQLVDAETGQPVQAYTMDDVPAETIVTTNRYGYFPQFKVPDTTRQLRMTFGGLTLENLAWELILGAEQAAEDAAAAWAAVQAIQNQVIAIDAPSGFDANSVNGQAIHMVNSLDEAVNMPGPGSWTLLTYPNADDGAALQQLALQYSTSGPQLVSRVKTSGGWSAWTRLDADKWIERLGQIEAKDTEQDDRLDGLDSIQAIKSVRFENGQWVWDLENPTHYVLIDHTGSPTVRATQWPQPSPTTPEFTW